MKTITVYSSKTCAPCRYIYHHLNKKGIAYEVKDIAEDEYLKELLELTKVRFVPVTVVASEDNINYVSGPNLPELDKLIGELVLPAQERPVTKVKPEQYKRLTYKSAKGKGLGWL